MSDSVLRYRRNPRHNGVFAPLPPMDRTLRYFRTLSPGKITLWCYLIWWGVTVYFRFDPTPAIWLNALGISAVIGVALKLSVGGAGGAKADPWVTFRLFWMPFAVSSFSSLIKGHGYVLIFPADLRELAVSCAACALFLAVVVLLKRLSPPGAA